MEMNHPYAKCVFFQRGAYPVDLYRLKIFLSAAETLSFTTSAERMNLTQSAVSHNIAALENELQVQLFTRSHNRLILTSYGETFYHDASRIIRASSSGSSRGCSWPGSSCRSYR